MAKIISFEAKKKERIAAKQRSEARKKTKEKRELSDQTKTAFNNFLSHLVKDEAFFDGGISAQAALAIEVMESENALSLKIPMKGVSKESLKLSASGGVLHIRMLELDSSKHTVVDPKKNIPIEIQPVFAQAIPIPMPVDEQKAKASLKDGFLEVVFPKAAEKKEPVKEIPID